MGSPGRTPLACVCQGKEGSSFGISFDRVFEKEWAGEQGTSAGCPATSTTREKKKKEKKKGKGAHLRFSG